MIHPFRIKVMKSDSEELSGGIWKRLRDYTFSGASVTINPMVSKPDYTISVEHGANPEGDRILFDGCVSHDAAFVTPPNYREFTIMMRDSERRIVWGISWVVNWTTFQQEKLAVSLAKSTS